MPRGKDVFWQYFETDPSGTSKVRCLFCNSTLTATITRLKYHLSGLVGNDVRRCTAVPDSVRDEAVKAIHEVEAKHKRPRSSDLVVSSVGSSQAQSKDSVSSFPTTARGSESCGFAAQPKIYSLIKKKEKEAADLLLMSMMVKNNLPFNLLRSEEFKMAMTAIANHGPGYITPSYETARTKLLATLKGQTEEYVKSVKESWTVSGCTIMSDSWTDARKRPHINLLAASPKGTIFLKSECTVGKKKDAAYIARFICEGIEEIGAAHVVQFISDNASNYVASGFIVQDRYPHVFKTSCAAHCIDLILEQIDELDAVRPILAFSRSVVKFMYKYQHVLDLMRTHTQGKELKRPGATRFATQFLCLQSVIREEQSLRNMVASNEWRSLPQSRSDDGMEITTTIQGVEFWQKGRQIIKVVEPLVRVLRMADGEGSTMCYLYEGMDRAKEGIKKAFNDDQSLYDLYWKIIDKRWNDTLDNPLHAFSGYLNPYLFWNKLVKMDKEVKDAIEKVKAKIVSVDERRDFSNDLKRYHSRDPCIFVESAIDLLENAAPRIWWDMFGIETPILQKVAIKLCSQPCSASGCERNWSAFDAAHTKKRNRLEPKKLHDLVYVRMNMHFMKTSAMKEAKDSDPIHLDQISAFPEDIGDGDEVASSSSDNGDDSASGDDSSMHLDDDDEISLDED